jgi:hypothetical protein
VGDAETGGITGLLLVSFICDFSDLIDLYKAQRDDGQSQYTTIYKSLNEVDSAGHFHLASGSFFFGEIIYLPTQEFLFAVLLYSLATFLPSFLPSFPPCRTSQFLVRSSCSCLIVC